MSFADLLVREATVYRFAESGADRYGSPARAEVGSATYPVWYEQKRSSEEVIDRNSVRVDGVLFLPAGSEIGALDEVELDGVRYEVDGEPARVWRGIGGGSEHHIEAELRVIRGK